MTRFVKREGEILWDGVKLFGKQCRDLYRIWTAPATPLGGRIDPLFDWPTRRDARYYALCKRDLAKGLPAVLFAMLVPGSALMLYLAARFTPRLLPACFIAARRRYERAHPQQQAEAGPDGKGLSKSKSKSNLDAMQMRDMRPASLYAAAQLVILAKFPGRKAIEVSEEAVVAVLPDTFELPALSEATAHAQLQPPLAWPESNSRLAVVARRVLTLTSSKAERHPYHPQVNVIGHYKRQLDLHSHLFGERHDIEATTAATRYFCIRSYYEKLAHDDRLLALEEDLQR